MNKKKAQRLLFIGYVFALIGCLVGFSSKFHNSVFVVLITGYLFWSCYWGWVLTYKKVKSFFNGMHTFGETLPQLFKNHLLKELAIYCIILCIGLVIGSFGGSVYMQIKLTPVAYR
ncbi:MAG: hypothetical protein A2279_07280 [Stygiobacter sp. RIFOXYA12_FULL_38_9]|nr:MAG: hypothetical protein A2279_07280 [Stygiobacter sp. RIFOXYA12_FULL_38_9]OGV08509.1 MAG: hypothetical protein A2299_00450 [Stygiobacter sp. RIFOXYB2_FULL_37_11]OGV14815.1 MAG: hypothetical protein A2440_09955 [Stygiobacter sp. RIFOXYC2_FULL_38_25]OGV79308.1 MAG: hypothetical protein A2X65_02325 [Stygiobacter sp. GWF2_38_21]